MNCFSRKIVFLPQLFGKVLSEQNLRKLVRKILDKMAIVNTKMDYWFNGDI